MQPNTDYAFWDGLDLTVMPDDGEDLIPNPNSGEVLDYIEAFCHQFDYGIGTADTLIKLRDKPETLPALKEAGNDFLRDSPGYKTLRFLTGLPETPFGPPNPWDPEPLWEKQDRREGRPPDTSTI